MGKTIRHEPIKLAPLGKPRMGHYEYHNGKAVHDNRPKRLRTRQTMKRLWLDT